jgi:hypothetical protein
VITWHSAACGASMACGDHLAIDRCGRGAEQVEDADARFHAHVGRLPSGRAGRARAASEPLGRVHVERVVAGRTRRGSGWPGGRPTRRAPWVRSRPPGREAGRPRLLDHLDARPPADEQAETGGGQAALRAAGADHLVDGVVPADVLANQVDGRRRRTPRRRGRRRSIEQPLVAHGAGHRPRTSSGSIGRCRTATAAVTCRRAGRCRTTRSSTRWFRAVAWGRRRAPVSTVTMLNSVSTAALASRSSARP